MRTRLNQVIIIYIRYIIREIRVKYYIRSTPI